MRKRINAAESGIVEQHLAAARLARQQLDKSERAICRLLEIDRTRASVPLDHVRSAVWDADAFPAAPDLLDAIGIELA